MTDFSGRRGAPLVMGLKTGLMDGFLGFKARGWRVGDSALADRDGLLLPLLVWDRPFVLTVFDRKVIVSIK